MPVPPGQRQHSSPGQPDGLACRSTVSMRRRAGFTIVELVGTMVLLGILFSMTAPMFVLVARERRMTEQRQFAMQHAANLLELAKSRKWNDLAPGELTLPDASADLTTVLPGLERHLTVQSLEGDLPSKQIVATVQWETQARHRSPPLQLSAWVFAPQETQ